MKSQSIKHIAIALAIASTANMAHAIHGAPLEDYSVYQAAKVAEAVQSMQTNPSAAGPAQPLPSGHTNFLPKRGAAQTAHRR